MIPDHNPAISELLEHTGLERSVAKKREPGSTKMEVSWSSEETHAKQLKIQTNPVNNQSGEVIPSEEKKWNDISACQYSQRKKLLKAEVSKLVMRLVRHYDHNERETDGAVHWNSTGPKL